MSAERETGMRKDFLVRELCGELIVYDAKTFQAHRLAPLAGALFESWTPGLSGRDLLRLVEERLQRVVSDSEFAEAESELRSAGLLGDEPIAQPPAPNRRDALLRVGMGIAAAVPLVVSIAVPTPADAATCLGAGSACATSSQCCSGLCIATVCQ